MINKKEMLMNYKLAERPRGVYQIRNRVNGKLLLGASLNLDGSRNSQFFQLKYGVHKNKAIVADWQLFGPDAFVFEILEQIESDPLGIKNDRELVDELLACWLEKLEPYGERGYNKQRLPKPTD